MMKKKWFLFLLLFLPACQSGKKSFLAQAPDNSKSTSNDLQFLDENRVRGEYLIETHSGKDDVIQKVFQKYTVLSITKSMSADFFIIKIKNDPGVSEIKNLIKTNADIKSIQENFTYKSSR